MLLLLPDYSWLILANIYIVTALTKRGIFFYWDDCALYLNNHDLDRIIQLFVISPMRAPAGYSRVLVLINVYTWSSQYIIIADDTIFVV